MDPAAVRERVRVAYDAIAPAFAARHAAMPPELSRLGTRLLERLGRPGPLLDVGCGAGRDMAWFEERGIAVTGLDLSMGMLGQARRRARGGLVRGDMRALPFSDGRFRAVWCMAALLHLPKAAAPVALGEMRRVLTPHGLLVLGLQEGAGEAWEPAPFGATEERLFARYSVGEVEDLLAEAGFAVIALDGPTKEARPWLNVLAAADGWQRL